MKDGKVKIGDRFRWDVPQLAPGYVTMVEFNGSNYVILEIFRSEITTNSSRVGDYFMVKNVSNSVAWKFIGNYAKQSNFEILYNLLNG